MAARGTAQARKLIARATANIVTLGRTLSGATGGADFAAYCEEVGIHIRKAYALVAVASAADEGYLTEAEGEEPGWTKASMIVSAKLRHSAAKHAAKFALDHNAGELQDYFRARHREKLLTKSFLLTEKKGDELDKVLLKAGGQRAGQRFQNRSEALMNIIRHYPDHDKRNTPPKPHGQGHLCD